MADFKSTAAVILRAENVYLRFGPARILMDVSIEVKPGTVTALVGPNGAGKSSLLRVLSGEIEPNEGTVRLNGRPLSKYSPVQQARRRSVMVQSAAMSFDFFVEEVLAMGRCQGRRSIPDRTSAEIIRDCRIGHLIGRKYNSLSGGERQRVQFARALLQVWRPLRIRSVSCSRELHSMPRYMLLDEPTASLDIAHELLILRLAQRACENNIGVFLVLHDLNLAARFAQRVALLVGGVIAAEGPPSDVFTDGTLSHVYRTRIQVERHERLGRLVVHTE